MSEETNIDNILERIKNREINLNLCVRRVYVALISNVTTGYYCLSSSASVNRHVCIPYVRHAVYANKDIYIKQNL